MHEGRLKRKVLEWDLKKGKCWSIEIKEIFSFLNSIQLYVNKDVCELKHLETKNFVIREPIKIKKIKII